LGEFKSQAKIEDIFISFDGNVFYPCKVDNKTQTFSFGPFSIPTGEYTLITLATDSAGREEKMVSQNVEIKQRKKPITVYISANAKE